MVNIYISSLRKYNDGMDNGRWLYLPMEQEELEKVVKEILGNDEELIILDYESPFTISEYENVFKLNDIAEQLELTKYSEDELTAIFEYESYYNIIDKVLNEEVTIIDVIKHASGWHCDSDETNGLLLHELGYNLLFDDIDESIIQYIDFGKVFRDLSFIYGWKEVKTDESTYLIVA